MLNLIIKAISIVPGILSPIMWTYFFYKTRGKHTIDDTLRYYWCFCIFPFIYLIGIGSVSLAIADIHKGNISGQFFTVIFPFLGICSQQIRTTTLLTIVERLIATVFLEKYTKYSQSFYTAVILSIGTYVITGTYIFFVSFYIPSGEISYAASTVIILCMHGTSIIASKFLQIKNCKMYKLLAFHVTLKRRYQIVKNVKILASIWYPLLTLAIIGPIGIILRWCFHFLLKEDLPYEIIYLSYNLAFIGIVLIKLTQYNKINRVEPVEGSDIQIIVSPLGEQLPAYVNVENYFKDLKAQWT